MAEESCSKGLIFVLDEIFGMVEDLGPEAFHPSKIEAARAEADEWIMRIKCDEKVEHFVTKSKDNDLTIFDLVGSLYYKTFTQNGTSATCKIPLSEIEAHQPKEN